MISTKMPKDYRRWVDAAVRQGWSLSQDGKHLKLTAPDGSYATPVPSTSGSPDLFKAFRSRLRRRGVTL